MHDIYPERGLYNRLRHGEGDGYDFHQLNLEAADAIKLLVTLVTDCQFELAKALIPGNGVTDKDAISNLLGRMDGAQAREAIDAVAKEADCPGM